ncbi:hypothetical protein [Massilia sp. CF038]|uniref:hypothetical protein n=1 Tax=Massilia sp. CF038 TaxID=1881045 RepID=UPI000932F90F|nr:hypothetical protein [Massilia sp. CF038]
MITHYTYWNEDFGYRFSISPACLKRAPQWLEHAEFPPLSPRIAIANSRIAVQRMLAEVQPFEPKFDACALKGDGASWHYVVSWFVPDLEDCATDWSAISIPVLFDGSTPDPLKFKYEDRFEVY